MLKLIKGEKPSLRDLPWNPMKVANRGMKKKTIPCQIGLKFLWIFLILYDFKTAFKKVMINVNASRIAKIINSPEIFFKR